MALLSLVAHSRGLTSPVIPGTDQRAEYIAPGDAAALVAQATRVRAPVRLHLLSVLSRGEVDPEILRPLAASLVHPDRTGEDAADTTEALLQHFSVPRVGSAPPAGLEGQLSEDLTEASHDSVPACTEALVEVDGVPAVSLTTTGWTEASLEDLAPMTDPRSWTECPLQHTFFREMTQVDGPPIPDDGGTTNWQAEMREVVDFSFGVGVPGAVVTTDLDFVHFADDHSAWCTYDLAKSVDGRISVDRGYLLVEDMAGPGRRRVTTLKQIYFTGGVEPGPGTCELWSLALAMVASDCYPSTTEET